MKVQRIQLGENRFHYLLLDDDYKIISPVKSYLDHLLLHSTKSPNTRKAYCQALKFYFTYLQEIGTTYDFICESIDKSGFEILADFICWLRNPEYINKKATPLMQFPILRSDTTINITMTAVLGFYDYLARDEKINQPDVYKLQKNIPRFMTFMYELANNREYVRASVLKLPTIPHEVEPITRDQYIILSKACNCKRDKLLLAIMFEGGLRLGEAIGLYRADISIWDKKLEISPRENLENQARVKRYASGTVEMPEYVLTLYLDYLSTEFDDFDSEFVFVNLFGKNRGKPMKHITVQKLFERLSKKTGIKVHPHMCRHGHATELSENGFTPLEIKFRLRHRNLKSIEPYLHLQQKARINKLRQQLNNKAVIS